MHRPREAAGRRVGGAAAGHGGRGRGGGDAGSGDAGGSWDAPDTPRVAFAGEPYLYKLYVTETRPYDPETEAEPAREATREFLAAFLPAAADALATPAAG